MKRFRDTEYFATEDGKIWSNKLNRFLFASKERGGYLRVNILIDGRSRAFRLHRVIAEIYIENPNNYPQVNHIDNDISNNSVKNLEWCTQAMNNLHQRIQKRHAFGTRSGRCKLTKENVLEIKSLLEKKELTNVKIASMFGVNETQISRIKHNKTRKFLEDEI